MDNLTELLILNKAYQEAISEKLDKLRQLLDQNYHRQTEIRDHLQLINNQSVLVADSTLKHHDGNEMLKIKESYLKYKFTNTPPDNQDTIRKSKLIVYEFIPRFKAEWTESSRKLLKNAVKEDSLRLLKIPCMSRIKLNEEKLALARKQKNNEAQREELKATIEQEKRKLEELDYLNENEIFEKIEAKKIDWLKISIKDLNSRWSEKECYLVWVNVCHPAINQDKWTQAESTRLVELARKYRERSWSTIAIELNTNRSAYLCMKRYFEKTALKYCQRDWTDEESRELLELVDMHRMGPYVPFNYLSYLIGSRNRQNLYVHYMRINPNLNRGKWSQQEVSAFEEAIGWYKSHFNWKEISEFIGTRTPAQCREKYELKYTFPDKYINWTMDEDRKLLDAYDRYGSQWVKISHEFPTRNDHSCLFRFKKLMEWKEKNLWFLKQPEEIREFLEFICKSRTNKELESTPENQLKYTSKGEIIPRPPKFMSLSSAIPRIIEKVYQKKDLVKEFISQKRNGKINIRLIDEIGIRTPIVNAIVKRSSIKQPNRIAETTKTELASEEQLIDVSVMNDVESTNFFRRQSYSKLTAEEKLDLSKQKKRKREMNRSRSGKRAKLATGEKVVRKKKEKLHSADTLQQRVKRRYTPRKSKSKQNEQLIAANLDTKPLVLVDSTTASLPVKRHYKPRKSKLPSESQEILNNEEPSVEKKKSTKIKKIREKNKKPSIRKILNIPSKDNQSPTTTTTPKQVKSKQSQITKIKSIQKNILNETSNIATDAHQRPNEINNNFNMFKQSELILNLNDIEEDVKIPCLIEESNSFRFLYSLKKDCQSHLLDKYTVIDCRGRLVAIKPMNKFISDSYLSERRFDLMEAALNKVFNVVKLKKLNKTNENRVCE